MDHLSPDALKLIYDKCDNCIDKQAFRTCCLSTFKCEVINAALPSCTIPGEEGDILLCLSALAKKGAYPLNIILNNNVHNTMFSSKNIWTLLFSSTYHSSRLQDVKHLEIVNGNLDAADFKCIHLVFPNLQSLVVSGCTVSTYGKYETGKAMGDTNVAKLKIISTRGVSDWNDAFMRGLGDSLGAQKCLQELCIKGSYEGSLSPFVNLTHLQKLELDENTDCEGFVDILKNAPNLKYFAGNFNDVSSFTDGAFEMLQQPSGEKTVSSNSLTEVVLFSVEFWYWRTPPAFHLSALKRASILSIDLRLDSMFENDLDVGDTFFPEIFLQGYQAFAQALSELNGIQFDEVRLDDAFISTGRNMAESSFSSLYGALEPLFPHFRRASHICIDISWADNSDERIPAEVWYEVTSLFSGAKSVDIIVGNAYVNDDNNDMKYVVELLLGILVCRMPSLESIRMKSRNSSEDGTGNFPLPGFIKSVLESRHE